MKYADPHACPACRGVINGGSRCPHCDFDLNSAQAHRLWGLFLEADRLVLGGRAQPVSAPTPQTAQASAAGEQPVRSSQIQPGSLLGDSVLAAGQAGVQEPVHVPRSWSTGSILLGLGAVCLIVAGIIFASVAWGSLGILGRAAILLVVTALVGVGAAAATRRRLFGTAEALWTVFLGLITVDVLAAVAEGLFGLDWDDFAVVSVIWTVVIATAGVAIVRWARSAFGHDLVTPQLAAGLAPWVSAPALLYRLGELSDENYWFWAALVALLIPVAVVLVARRLRLTWAFWPSAILSLFFLAALVSLAIESALDEPTLSFAGALPTLTLAAAAVVGGVLFAPARSWAAGFSTVGVLFLLEVGCTGWALASDVSASAGRVVVAIAVAVLALFVVRTNAWALGVRWAAVLGGAGIMLWASFVATANLERVGKAAWFSSPADVWVRPTEMSITEGAWVIAVIAALLVAWWGARRWSSPTLVPSSWWTPLALIAGGAAVVTAIAASQAPFLIHSAALTAVGVALAIGLRRSAWAFMLVPPGVIGLAMIVVPTDANVTAWAWGLAAAGFAVCSLVGFDDPSEIRRGVSAVTAGLAVGVAIATMALILDLAGVDRAWLSTVIAGCAAAALLLTLALEDVPWHRWAIEIVAAIALAAAVLGSSDDLATVSLLFTIGAVAAVLVGLLDDDRTYLRWIAAGLVGAAWIARLAASEVQTVEAYTAPFAVAVLAAGVWRLRTDPASRTWSTLAPGLTLALLPSLPQALGDPTSLRAGLLALVAAGCLAAGVMLRWGAPVAGGSTVLLLIVLANVGPTALALQRWILIAIAGLVLLVVGTTWEKRVADGRALMARLTSLR